MCCLSHSNSQRPLHQQRPRRSWKRWLSSEQVAPWVHLMGPLWLCVFQLCCVVRQWILAGYCCHAQRLEAGLFSPEPQKPVCPLIWCLLFVGLALLLHLVTLSVELFQQGSAVIKLRCVSILGLSAQRVGEGRGERKAFEGCLNTHAPPQLIYRKQTEVNVCEPKCGCVKTFCMLKFLSVNAANKSLRGPFESETAGVVIAGSPLIPLPKRGNSPSPLHSSLRFYFYNAAACWVSRDLGLHVRNNHMPATITDTSKLQWL